MAAKLIDRTGRRYGRLVVVSRAPSTRDLSDGRLVTQWLCRCDCGEMHTARGGSLHGGQTLSCGCLRAENCSKLAARRRS